MARSLLLRALFGAGVVVVIQLLARTRSYYIAGLVPLFPTFTLISNYIVGTERTVAELKTTLRFSMASMVPYGVYLIALYLLVDRLKFRMALLGAVVCWAVVAVVLIVLWHPTS